MNRTPNESSAMAARALMRGMAAGVLATQSVEVEGYPLGSLVPYVLTPEARCVVYVSRIAQHTLNFERDPRVALTVVEAALSGADGDPQAAGRVSVLGNASVLTGAARDSAQQRYATFFPESTGHSGVHDFDYWQIDPVRVRYIGGFGAIHWIESETFLRGRTEWQDGESDIVRHMNEDHRDAMAAIWRWRHGRALGHSDSQDAPEMLASDPEGFHMRWNGRTAYVPYGDFCETAMAVRKEMVRLTREARESS